jgi:DNA-binding NarL/FixJ family response regulator
LPKKLRAIIVDDHPIVRNALVTSLASIGIIQEVEAANSFQELNESLEQDASCQLLIIDLSLTDISVQGGMVYMREHYPDIPILVFSENDSIDIIIQCFEQGVHGFVSKHASMQIFVNAIRVVIAGGIYIPPSAVHRMGFMPSGSTSYELEWVDDRPEFTAKQKEICEQLLLGVPNKVIAKRLGIAEGTVKTHLQNIYQLLHVNSRAQAILKFQKLQFIGCAKE